MLYTVIVRHLISSARTLCHVALLGCFALQQTAQAQAPDDGTALETVIVTASRTPDLGLTLPVAWSALDESTIERIAPQHSNQVFNRVAGASDLPALTCANRCRQLRRVHDSAGRYQPEITRIL
jgi:hypothetical protein